MKKIYGSFNFWTLECGCSRWLPAPPMTSGENIKWDKFLHIGSLQSVQLDGHLPFGVLSIYSFWYSLSTKAYQVAGLHQEIMIWFLDKLVFCLPLTNSCKAHGLQFGRTVLQLPSFLLVSLMQQCLEVDSWCSNILCIPNLTPLNLSQWELVSASTVLGLQLLISWMLAIFFTPLGYNPTKLCGVELFFLLDGLSTLPTQSSKETQCSV